MQHSAANIEGAEGAKLFGNIFYFSRRKWLVAAALFLLVAAGGCAMFDSDNWNVDALRDDRAVDIDHRLEGTKPIVVNPF